MRLQNGASNDVKIQEFADWILKLGDGVLGEPNDSEVMIEIPDEFLTKNAQDPIASIVHSTYPNLINALSDGSLFHDRAILAPTNEIVCIVNEHVLSLICGEEKVYLSSNSVSKTYSFVNNHTDAFSVEFLNTIRCFGLPNHEIRLKKGVPIMLLRNIDQSAGLCNETRLTVNRLEEHIIEAKILTCCKKGDIVLIPRMTLTPSDSAHLPINLQRRLLLFAQQVNVPDATKQFDHCSFYYEKYVHIGDRDVNQIEKSRDDG
ncbi:uncharacterized protein LOC130800985 [Amaranthus tricolor]|uniref:uncharacterized protein LOC130800985 n=1 Tax=Amaranthus tricolor TaxID=29722 RepID=UPI00258F5D7E|nr:uncharacterized protein LOC130800985 [Amaranthus tricolor]